MIHLHLERDITLFIACIVLGNLVAILKIDLHPELVFKFIICFVVSTLKVNTMVRPLSSSNL